MSRITKPLEPVDPLQLGPFPLYDEAKQAEWEIYNAWTLRQPENDDGDN